MLSSVSTALVLWLRRQPGALRRPQHRRLLLFVFSIERFFQPIRELVLQYAHLQRAMAGGSRVFEVLDTSLQIVDAPDAVVLDDIQGER